MVVWHSRCPRHCHRDEVNLVQLLKVSTLLGLEKIGSVNQIISASVTGVKKEFGTFVYDRCFFMRLATVLTQHASVFGFAGHTSRGERERGSE